VWCRALLAGAPLLTAGEVSSNAFIVRGAGGASAGVVSFAGERSPAPASAPAWASRLLAEAGSSGGGCARAMCARMFAEADGARLLTKGTGVMSARRAPGERGRRRSAGCCCPGPGGPSGRPAALVPRGQLAEVDQLLEVPGALRRGLDVGVERPRQVRPGAGAARGAPGPPAGPRAPSPGLAPRPSAGRQQSTREPPRYSPAGLERGEGARCVSPGVALSSP